MKRNGDVVMYDANAKTETVKIANDPTETLPPLSPPAPDGQEDNAVAVHQPNHNFVPIGGAGETMIIFVVLMFDIGSTVYDIFSKVTVY